MFRTLCLCLILLTGVGLADEILETRFFQVTPGNWEVSRNDSGLWTLSGPEARVQFSVARLNSTPEAYVKGQAALWARLGFVKDFEPLTPERENQSWFLVKQSQEGSPTTIKWVQWDNSLLVVTNFVCEDSVLEQCLSDFEAIARSVELKSPEFREENLRQEVLDALSGFADTRAELSSPDQARRQMSATRQDWEPFFLADVPPLYRSYLAYLEARFDAAFAVAHGEEMGIGPELVEARLRSVGYRRDELKAALEGKFPEL